MSVYFDTVWWWRAEFGNRSNPYLENDDEQMTSSSQPAMAYGIDSSSALMLADTDLPDWNWDELGDLGLNWYQ
jgi:hypothetical protein